MTTTVKLSNASPRVVIHASSNTGALVVAGNSTVSNLTSYADEIVTGASISQVAWGTDAGSWQVYRDAELVGVYNNSGHINYAAFGLSIDVTPSGNLTANLVGSSNGFITIEIKKY